jgi:hypothetical protein
MPGGPLFEDAGTAKWQWYKINGDSTLYLRDLVDSATILSVYPGAPTAALLQVAGVLGMGASATGSRPNAIYFSPGGMWYDTTLHKPIWTDGSVWRDAAGTAV